MEQLVDRLDTAMFNAILRESAEEMPTDPVSDPISDSRVLPIPHGRSSFGSGVELKNSVSTEEHPFFIFLNGIFGSELMIVGDKTLTFLSNSCRLGTGPDGLLISSA